MGPNWVFMHNVESEEQNIYVADMAIRRREILGKLDLGIQHFFGSTHPSAVFLPIRGTWFFAEICDLAGIWDGSSPVARIFSVMQLHYEF